MFTISCCWSELNPVAIIVTDENGANSDPAVLTHHVLDGTAPSVSISSPSNDGNISFANNTVAFTANVSNVQTNEPITWTLCPDYNGATCNVANGEFVPIPTLSAELSI